MNKIVYILTLGTVGIITTEFGIVGLLPEIATYFGISMDRAGLLVSLFALAVAISGPLVTLLLSRFDRKRVVQFSLITFIVSNIISSQSISFGCLLAARVLPAFFLTAYFSTALVIASEAVDKRLALKAVTTIYGGLSIATVLGIPFTSWLAGGFSWQTSFWFPAALNIFAFAGIMYIVPSMQQGTRLSYRSQLTIFRKPVLWLNLGAVCAMAAGSFCVYSYFADYLEKIFFMDHDTVSLMLMVFGVAGVLGNWVAGIMLAKSLYKAIFIYVVSMVTIYMLLYVVGAEISIVVIFIIVLWGFCHMGGFVISQAWVHAVASEAPALANSLVVSTANLGIAMGAAAGGAIISGYGVHYIVLGGIMSFAVALLAILLRRRIRMEAI